MAVISDSHNDITNLNLFIDRVKNKVDLIIHLGDDSDDVNILLENKFSVMVVPGVYEGKYVLPDTKRRIIQKFENKTFLLTHTPTKHTNDLQGEPGPETLAKQVDIVLYGHTHIPKIEHKQDGKIWLNPGHLKTNDKRGFPPSYAVLEINSINSVTIYNLKTSKPLMSGKL